MQNEHVMPVEMHGMRKWYQVLEYDTDGLVLAEVVDVPFRMFWVRDVAQLGEEEDRVIVICAESLPVHGPHSVTRIVDSEVDGDV